MAQKTKKTPIPKKRGVRLQRADDVRRLLTRLINDTLNNKLDEKTLRAVTYSAQTVLHVFELILFEQRVDQIEAAIDEIRKSN